MMSPIIPRTVHGLDPFVCLSAMHKSVRRGLEREAMEFACELGHTSKGFATMVANRLEVISHEDVSLAAPEVIPLVHASCTQARAWFDLQLDDLRKMGKWRMAIGTAIRALCRAEKSREGDHFQAAVGMSMLLDGRAPEIPDWAYDHHTTKGRKMGRGVEYFLTEATKLRPKSAEPDRYAKAAKAIVKAVVSTVVAGGKPKAAAAGNDKRGRRSKSTTQTLFG